MCRLQIIMLTLVFSVVVEAESSDPMIGKEIIAPFKQNLQKALLGGLTQGPEQAIDVCKLKAPKIAELQSRDGVRVGRTSKRLRNPSNIAPEWVAPILETYTKHSTDRAPRTVSLEGKRKGYVEPIIVQPLCLTCHGTSLPSEVSSHINDVYPEDKAIGYQAGDLRGVFWVEYLN